MFASESCEHGNWHKLESLIDSLPDVNLPQLKLSIAYEDILSDFDYTLLYEDEKNKWEEKADKFNEDNPNGMYHSGLSLWMEEGAYEEFAEQINTINNQIENYLNDIDEKHGTQYCPTGFSRLN